MALSIRRRIGLSVLASALVAASVAVVPHIASPSQPTAAPETTQVDAGDVRLAANTNGWYQVVWDVDAGGEGYQHFIERMRALITATGGHRETVPVGGSRNPVVDVLNPQANREYAAVEVQGGGTNVHLVVRLSDLYVIGFHYRADGGGNVYLPLTNDSPDIPPSLLDGGEAGYALHGDWRGRENYNTLAAFANTRLEDVQLSQATLDDAIHAMRVTPQLDAPNLNNPTAPRSTQAMNKARGLLRMIAAVSEGTRLRQLAGAITSSLNNFGTLTLGNQFVEQMRNWAKLSNVYTVHRDSPAAHATVQLQASRPSLVDSMKTAVALLLVALPPNKSIPKDEL